MSLMVKFIIQSVNFPVGGDHVIVWEGGGGKLQNY